MNPKKKHQLMHQLVCIKMIELEIYDQLKLTSQQMLQQVKFCEEFINSIAATSTIQKTTYFNDMVKKIETIIRKDFDETV
jgi:hypothetical protein